jgi:hypothetical protein
MIIEDALNKAQAENVSIRERMNREMNAPGNNETQTMIQRPKGMAGTDFSIQEGMELSGSKKGYNIYKGIQVCCEGNVDDLLTEIQFSAVFAILCSMHVSTGRCDGPMSCSRIKLCSLI